MHDTTENTPQETVYTFPTQIMSVFSTVIPDDISHILPPPVEVKHGLIIGGHEFIGILTETPTGFRLHCELDWQVDPTRQIMIDNNQTVMDIEIGLGGAK